MKEAKFRFGIEEEYFLVDADTGESPDAGAADCFHQKAADLVEPASHELLKGQIEVQTKPSVDFDDAHAALRGMRHDLAEVAGDFGLCLIAAGSHPLAESRDQQTTESERYQKLKSEFGIIAQRSVVCATHIHVEVPDADRRIDTMNRLIPFLPLLYALSVSSPFWQGHDSGIKGFRLTAFSEWPRMGVPEIFPSKAEYDRFIDLLVQAKVMRDGSFVWWHIRPSTHYPTLELRVCDSCTRVDDVVAIAALYQALVRAVTRRPDINDGTGPVDRGVCSENIWQVQQHGIDAMLIDARRGGTASVSAHLDAVLDLVAEDAEALGTSDQVSATRTILSRGTSADRQLATFKKAKGSGVDDHTAIRAVIQKLVEETCF